MRKFKIDGQLCFYCSNFYKCDWARYAKPIEGWDATEVTINDLKKTKSYKIIDCPQFKQDRKFLITMKEFGRYSNKSEEDVKEIINLYRTERKILKDNKKYKELIIAIVENQEQIEFYRNNYGSNESDYSKKKTYGLK